MDSTVEESLYRSCRSLTFLVSLGIMVLGLAILYQTRNPYGDVMCPEIFFDPSTLHSDLTISDRRDSIANTKRYMKHQQLKKYNGILGVFYVMEMP
uniref:Uncharacterized protein LOC111133923 isoform X2 n=1 Tax=Crassostrea virginica TaxID=6565 RepID=A0A8B8EFI6_CRAVI|nr:uncharacterized protein LOC111133923 isoform X2 [Crassostrea virginica]